MSRRIVLGLGSLLLHSAACAAGSSAGPVTTVYAYSGDVAMFAAGTHQGKPACSTAAEDWAFTLTTPTGKAMLALLISAQAQGKAVTVGGTGACSAWSDREAPLYIVISQ